MCSVRRSNKKWRYVVRMDVCWSTVLKLEHPCIGGSRYIPWAAVQSTTASRTIDISIVVIWRISFKSFTRRRRRASQRSSECYIRRRRRRRRWCCGVAPNQTKDLLWCTCTAQPTRNNRCRWFPIDVRSHVGLVTLIKTFPKNAPRTIIKWRWGVSMDVEWSTVLELEHPWYRGVKLYNIIRGAEHNSESCQRYRNCRDLENFI